MDFLKFVYHCKNKFGIVGILKFILNSVRRLKVNRILIIYFIPYKEYPNIERVPQYSQAEGMSTQDVKDTQDVKIRKHIIICKRIVYFKINLLLHRLF